MATDSVPGLPTVPNRVTLVARELDRWPGVAQQRRVIGKHAPDWSGGRLAPAQVRRVAVADAAEVDPLLLGCQADDAARHSTDQAAVGDDHEQVRLVEAFRMVIEGSRATLGDVCVGLAVCPARATFVVSKRPLRVAGGGFVVGQAGPAADIDLAQVGIGDDREAQSFRERPNRLLGAYEIRRDDMGRLLFRKWLDESVGLLEAQRIQRNIGMALPASLAAPIGLAMSNHDHACH